MKRLFYLTDNLEAVDEIATALSRSGIDGWNFHVMSRDESGLYKHHLRSATPLQSNDVVRSGERGALIGLAGGAVVAGVAIMAFEYLQAKPLLAFAIIVAIAALHGAWIGAMAGLSMQNYQVKKFARDIDAGRYLLIVDADRRHLPVVRELMQRFGLDVKGENSSIPLPFSA